MPNEKIQFSLKERFAAPLPEFFHRRIVFWQDPDREFEKDVDELELPGVRVIRLTGTNNFAVKKLLLHDDLQSDFLIYCPLAYADEQEDWLQDIEYYSEIFQADFISLQMEELNIAPSTAMRRAVKLYARFLESKERRLKLRRIGHEYQSPGQLHIDVMTVLAGVEGGTPGKGNESRPTEYPPIRQHWRLLGAGAPPYRVHRGGGKAAVWLRCAHIAYCAFTNHECLGFPGLGTVYL